MTRRANRLAEKPAARGLRRWAFVALATLAATTASCARVESEGATPTTQTASQTTAKMTSTLADADAVAPTIDASGKWKVLAVGVNKYADAHFRPLDFSEKDARDVADAFVKLGASEDDVMIVDFPNKRNIERACSDFFGSLQRGDRAVVFFSGHGIQFDAASGGVESFFVPNDCVYENAETARETAVSINRVMTQFEESRASFKWMIVDACRFDPTKATPLFGASKGVNLTSVPDSIVLLQSCKAGYVSYEGRGEINGKPVQNSIFTLSLLEALDPDASPADADGNGAVSFTELFAYVVQTTDERAKRQEEGRPQRPYLLGNATDFTLFDGLGRSNAVKAKELFVEAKKLADEKKYAEARKIMKDVEALEPNNPVYASYAALLEELSKQANAIAASTSQNSSSETANADSNVEVGSQATPFIIPETELEWEDYDHDSWNEHGVMITNVKNKSIAKGVCTFPNELGNKPVVGIGMRCFENCDSMTRLIIPEGVRWNACTFCDCPALTSISLPSSLYNLSGYSAPCGGATALRSVEADSNSPYYASVNGVLYSKDMSRLVLYPRGKDDLDYYETPLSVTEIGYYAFCGNSSLKTIRLSKNVADIAADALTYASDVNIVVDVENEKFLSEQGVLFSKNKEWLVRVPTSLKDYRVPQGVKIIWEFAFDNCSELQSVDFPSTLKWIQLRAFEDCAKLEELRFPESLEHIDDFAFANCSKLTYVELNDGLKKIGDWAFPDNQIDFRVKKGSAAEKLILEYVKKYKK